MSLNSVSNCRLTVESASPYNVRNNSSSESSFAGGAAQRGAKTAFPADFELTEEMIAWAKAKNPDADVQKATEKFKIHHKNNLKADWYGAWEKWIIDENPPGGNYPPKRGSQMDAYRATVGAFDND